MNTPDEIITIRPQVPTETLQRLPYFVGISGTSAGTRGLSMNKVIIPPGAKAEPHSHVGFETAIYLIEGRVETRYGRRLEKSVVNKPGDFLFIPPDLPHEARNLSDTEPAVAIIARNTPSEQESVKLYEPPAP